VKDQRKVLVRIATIPMSLNLLLKGQLHFLNKYYRVIAISSRGEDLKEVEEREQVATIAVEMKRDISIFSDFLSLTRFIFTFYKIKPFIVHANTPKASLLSMIAAWITRVPNRIYTVTGLRFEGETGFKKKLLISMERLTCKFATKVIPEGQGVLKSLKQYNITTKDIKVIHNGNINGINMNYFDPKFFSSDDKNGLKVQLGISTNDLVYVFVGRLVADKGINELIDAFDRLSKVEQSVSLILVGSFEQELDPLSKTTLEIIKINSKIKTIGYQKDIRQYLAISDVFAFPSYREGFPNVVLQAAAMELPCIVTNISGCNEIIQNDQNGLIIPFKNADALFIAMQKLYSDRNLRLRLKQNTRQIIQTRYECTAVWNALLKEYHQFEDK